VPAGTPPKTKPISVVPLGRTGLVKYTYRPETPKAPSEADLEFQQQVKAIGPKVVAKAANPRVAALSNVLGAATGIPSAVHAVRSANVGQSALAAASFLPIGKFGKLLEGGADVLRAAKTEDITGRLAELESTHKAFLRKIAPTVSDYGGGQASQRKALAEAEAKMHALAEANPEHPGPKAYMAMRDEMARLRGELQRRSEASLGGDTASKPVQAFKQAPKKAAEAVKGAAPKRSTIVTKKVAKEIQIAQKKIAQVEAKGGPQTSVEHAAYERAKLIVADRQLAKADAAARESRTAARLAAKPPMERVPAAPGTQPTRGFLKVEDRLVPAVRKGQATPETGGTVGQQIREGLNPRKMSALRAEQEELRRPVVAERTGRLAGAMADRPGMEGVAAGLGHLSGELPRTPFHDLEHLQGNPAHEASQMITETPRLGPHEKANAAVALDNAIHHGLMPTHYEQQLLEQVFGREQVRRFLLPLTTWQSLGNKALNVANIPRAIQASLDASYLLRQGLVAAAGHPVMAARAVPGSFRAMFSEAAHEGAMEALQARPNAVLYERGHVPFTDLGKQVSKREEQFASSYAETITGGKYSFVRASGRAYNNFLNTMRANLFDLMVENARAKGEILDDETLRSFGNVAGVLTGRGTFQHKTLEGAAPLFNTLFFSPRLFKSRIDAIRYAAGFGSVHPIARREVQRGLASLIGSVTLVLAAAKAIGGEVESDPRSADFGKIKLGNTRIDLLGGFIQPAHLAAEEATQSTKSSTTGVITHFGQPGPAKQTGLDAFIHFIESKAAPGPGLAISALQHQLPSGDALTPKNLLKNELLPLSVQDALSVGQDTRSIPAGIGAFGLSGVGVGVQNYKAKPAKTRGGGDSWTGGGSGYSWTGGSSGSWGP
jgi:hypothetical protein